MLSVSKASERPGPSGNAVSNASERTGPAGNTAHYLTYLTGGLCPPVIPDVTDIHTNHQMSLYHIQGNYHQRIE